MITPIDIPYQVSNENNVPVYKHYNDAGMDLKSTEAITLYPNKTIAVNTGVKMRIPDGFYGTVASRSGLALHHSVAVLNSGAVIDSGFIDNIRVILHNHSDQPYMINKGERIAQMVIIPYVKANLYKVDSLEDTERGTNGFGSTGTS